MNIINLIFPANPNYQALPVSLNVFNSQNEHNSCSRKKPWLVDMLSVNSSSDWWNTPQNWPVSEEKVFANFVHSHTLNTIFSVGEWFESLLACSTPGQWSSGWSHRIPPGRRRPPESPRIDLPWTHWSGQKLCQQHHRGQPVWREKGQHIRSQNHWTPPLPSQNITRRVFGKKEQKHVSTGRNVRHLQFCTRNTVQLANNCKSDTMFASLWGNGSTTELIDSVSTDLILSQQNLFCLNKIDSVHSASILTE